MYTSICILIFGIFYSKREVIIGYKQKRSWAEIIVSCLVLPKMKSQGEGKGQWVCRRGKECLLGEQREAERSTADSADAEEVLVSEMEGRTMNSRMYRLQF